MAIRYSRQIQINASPERIFCFIETMPNKFPVSKIFETRPFLFIRLLLVDGFQTAIVGLKIDKPKDVLVLNIGDTLKPFTLTESQKPLRYWFSLRSFFFNCQTGYSIGIKGALSTLEFDLIAENPGVAEKIYWFLIKPVHGLLAGKALRIIKMKIENPE